MCTCVSADGVRMCACACATGYACLPGYVKVSRVCAYDEKLCAECVCVGTV